MKILSGFKYEILVGLIFILIHLPALGHDTFNTDVFKWKVRSYDFGSAVFSFNFEQTIQKYHPGVTLMWLGTFAIKIGNVLSDIKGGVSELDLLFLLHFYQKLFVVSAIAVGVSACLYVLRHLYGLPFALLGVVLMSLEPFYMALTREFHLEGLLSTFMFAAVLWLYWYTTDPARPLRLVASGLFAGLAILTKTSGLFLVLFAGLILVLLTKKPLKSRLLPFTKWVLTTVITIFILWPALWVSPGHVYEELVRGVVEIGIDTDHIQFYFGKLVGDPGPTYYPVVFSLRSSLILFIGVFGILFSYKKMDLTQKKFINYLALFCLFYLVQLTLPSKKLDRYILPLFLPLTLIATSFYYFVLTKIQNPLYRKLYIVTIIAILGLTNLRIHYDYMSYYNPLFGGISTGIKIVEPKWLIGQKEILAYFTMLKAERGFADSGQDQSFEEVMYRESNSEVLAVGFQEKYYTQIWPFFREINSWAVIQDIRIFAEHANFLVYPIWDDHAPKEDRFLLKHIADIKIRGVVVYRVYEKIT